MSTRNVLHCLACVQTVTVADEVMVGGFRYHIECYRSVAEQCAKRAREKKGPLCAICSLPVDTKDNSTVYNGNNAADVKAYHENCWKTTRAFATDHDIRRAMREAEVREPASVTERILDVADATFELRRANSRLEDENARLLAEMAAAQLESTQKLAKEREECTARVERIQAVYLDEQARSARLQYERNEAQRLSEERLHSRNEARALYEAEVETREGVERERNHLRNTAHELSRECADWRARAEWFFRVRAEKEAPTISQRITVQTSIDRTTLVAIGVESACTYLLAEVKAKLTEVEKT